MFRPRLLGEQHSQLQVSFALLLGTADACMQVEHSDKRRLTGLLQDEDHGTSHGSGNAQVASAWDCNHGHPQDRPQEVDQTVS